MEACEISQMLFAHAGNHVFGGDALFFGGKHHGRAVGVVGAAVVAFVAAQFLQAHPNIGLDMLDHVSEMNRAVGIGQGRGNEDFAGHDFEKNNLKHAIMPQNRALLRDEAAVWAAVANGVV